MIEEAIGKIIGMAFAYVVSGLGLLVAYINYRKRIVKADKIFTATAWSVMAAILVAACLGVVVVALLATPPSAEEPEAAVVAVVPEAAIETAPPDARPPRRTGEGSQWSVLGLVLPIIIFLFATVLTAALYRHFSRRMEHG
jgi:disulfide bond formation protein DsbB